MGVGDQLKEQGSRVNTSPGETEGNYKGPVKGTRGLGDQLNAILLQIFQSPTLRYTQVMTKDPIQATR